MGDIRRWLRVLAAFAAGLFVSVSAVAQTPVPYQPDVETWVTHAHGRLGAHQIWVYLPDGYSKAHAPYSVLIATDANAFFGTLVDTARVLMITGQMPPTVVVGIGYPVAGQGIKAMHVGRTFDLTPTRSDEGVAGANRQMPAGTPVATDSGGAPEFLAFIVHELVPTLEAKYNVSQDDRAYLGWSLGGLFGTYALFEGKGLFTHFIITSPSLWWDNRAIFNRESDYAAKSDSLKARVFFSVGGDETKMASDLKEFVDRVEARHYDGFSYQMHVFEDESHRSVSPFAISRGLRYIYAKP